jgi:hypothetical protein
MRVVFLDFDGVLHRAGGPPGTSLPFEWTDELAALLNPFDDVFIVVHSSWREQFSVEILREFLEPIGHRLMGVVDEGAKGAAIEAFLREHPEISDAVVLDDQPAEFHFGFSVPVLVCDPAEGLSCGETQRRIRSWLQGKELLDDSRHDSESG